jgi:hypothetical protein
LREQQNLVIFLAHNLPYLLNHLLGYRIDIMSCFCVGRLTLVSCVILTLLHRDQDWRLLRVPGKNLVAPGVFCHVKGLVGQVDDLFRALAVNGKQRRAK